MAGAGLISCPECGASYPFKPQLVGKKVRCKCGKLFEARPPKALPAQAVAEPETIPVDEDSDVSVIPSKRKMPTVMRPPGAARGATTMPPPTSSASELAAAYPTHGRRRVAAVQQEADDESSKKKLILPLAIVMVLVAGGIFLALAFKGGMIGAASKPMVGDDKMITDMIKDENGTEVKEWLKANSRHMFFDVTEGQAIGMADRLYAMGAVKVYAFGEVISRSVAVELPDDPAKRKALFDFEKEHNGWRSKSKDVGQRYFLLWM